MTTVGQLGHVTEDLHRDPIEPPGSSTTCPKCPEAVLEAVHDLLDDAEGLLAKTWLDSPSTVRWFVTAGAPEALERHGWTFWTDGRGGCRLERLEFTAVNDDLPMLWVRDCLVEGGELTLAEAAGSYRAWLIEYRAQHPHLFPKDQEKRKLTSPPRTMDGGGKRLLRRLGYRTTRKNGPTRFVGVSLKPEADMRPAAATASDEGDPMAALVALADMVPSRRDLDVAWLRLSGEAGRLCSRCGVMTRHPDTHKECPDVRARYASAPVTTNWTPGMGGLAEEEVEQEEDE